MFEHLDESLTGRSLPITEHSGGSPLASVLSEEQIRVLVDTFYGEIRREELLGPIFAEHVADWSLHLPKMYDFWSTVVLRTGRYSGRPIEVHQRVGVLTPAHFARWLAIWKETVDRVIDAPAAREAFIASASRMAESISARVVA